MKYAPLEVLAYAFAALLILSGIGILLKFVLPAFGAMIGIAGAILSGSLKITVINSWIIPSAAAGLAIGGGAGGIVILVGMVKKAKQNPYEWALPVLAIISGLAIDTCKELYQVDSPIIRLFYGASVTGLYLIGGIIWVQQSASLLYRIIYKAIAMIFFLLPPAMIYIKYCQVNQKRIVDGFQDIPNHILGAFIILLVILAVTTLIAWLFEKQKKL